MFNQNAMSTFAKSHTTITEPLKRGFKEKYIAIQIHNSLLMQHQILRY